MNDRQDSEQRLNPRKAGGHARPSTRTTGEYTARGLALRVLSDLRGGRLTARESIDALTARHQPPQQEVHLATELVLGVVRHRLTLARVLGGLACRGWKNISERLQHILMIGAYQLVYLDAIPAFAAVNEAVEQAKAEGGSKAGRFVNAVLRQLIREIETRRMPADRADPVRSVPVDPRTSCQFKRDVMPDPTKTPLEYIADSTSHPLWLVSRWAKAFGFETAARICRAGLERPPWVLRPNRLRTDAAELARRLREEGLLAEITPDGKATVLTHSASLMQTRAFKEGLFQPQDLTSMQAVEQACGELIRPGQLVLDLCAGLGTKTTQLAELMRNQGTVLATDQDSGKLEPLRANCERLGLSIVRTATLRELSAASASLGPPDWIIVDAPCSNTGVLARRPEARYRLNQRAIATIAGVQRRLLDQAAALAGGHARLVYITCSIDPEENEDVSTTFAHLHLGWTLDDSCLNLPQPAESARDWRDGGYWARWSRR